MMGGVCMYDGRRRAGTMREDAQVCWEETRWVTLGMMEVCSLDVCLLGV